MTTLHIEQTAIDDKHNIQLRLERVGHPSMKADVQISFELTPQEQEDMRWYMEDYLQSAAAFEAEHVWQIEKWMKHRGEELYSKVLTANSNTQAIWFTVREHLADLRIEISSDIAGAASIPWELMRDPQSDSAVALRAKAFVRVQSDPSIPFINVPPVDNGRVRILYVVCRPGRLVDVELRAVAHRLLNDLGPGLARFDISVLRPPTFEQLHKELTDARFAGRPFHIVHFDGHGVYDDLSNSILADWITDAGPPMVAGSRPRKRGYLLFEHPSAVANMRPVTGTELGQLLHDTGVPVLVLNACQTAMHEAFGTPAQNPAGCVHGEIRAIGSLTQAVIDQGVPAVLGMRYSVYVATAAQYIGELYRAIAKGRAFGEAASEARRHLAACPERWVGLMPRTLQDWLVPVVYEAAPVHFLPPAAAAGVLEPGHLELDPAQTDPMLRRYVPDTGFVGRDETLLMLDRAFDSHSIVLLHGYAGQGKSSTAIEFARWYAKTGGLGSMPIVLVTSFETHADLTDVLNQCGQRLVLCGRIGSPKWHAINDDGARAKLIIQVLQHTPVLWIWDNIESISGFPAGTQCDWTLDEQIEIADFLKQLKVANGTKARVLLTSRRDEELWLGQIPHHVAMPRMSRSDTTKLARTIASDRLTDSEEIAHWQPLIDYCQGNPLTLRILVGQVIRMRLKGRDAVAQFVSSIRNGEQAIEDADMRQGHDRSLYASLDYGFRNAFADNELSIVAILHLFQGIASLDAFEAMAMVENYLPELKSATRTQFASVLSRASEVGLLSHISGPWYAIHPALPWFLRPLFARRYDGQAGRSTADAALRAWVEAFGHLGAFGHRRAGEGNEDVIQLFAQEEGNLMWACRIALQREWWDAVVPPAMGLRTLYEYQGRFIELSRLSAEITPHFCMADDGPVRGREDGYAHVIEARVALAKRHEPALDLALSLQTKLVQFNRQRAKAALESSPEVSLGTVQREQVRSLGVGLLMLGQILMMRRNAGCISVFEEAVPHFKRVCDEAAESIVHYNRGEAYLRIESIRDLGAAEEAFSTSLRMLGAHNTSGRAATLNQRGIVCLEQFREAQRRGEAPHILREYLATAEQLCRKALHTCPADALQVRRGIHQALGAILNDVGRGEAAIEHFVKDLQISEQIGDRRSAGETRFNMGIAYLIIAEREVCESRRCDLLLRAKAYADASLRDFQSFDGQLRSDETNAGKLLAEITKRLAGLPTDPSRRHT